MVSAALEDNPIEVIEVMIEGFGTFNHFIYLEWEWMLGENRHGLSQRLDRPVTQPQIDVARSKMREVILNSENRNVLVVESKLYEGFK